jgi:hypothetical protein
LARERLTGAADELGAGDRALAHPVRFGGVRKVKCAELDQLGTAAGGEGLDVACALTPIARLVLGGSRTLAQLAQRAVRDPCIQLSARSWAVAWISGHDKERVVSEAIRVPADQEVTMSRLQGVLCGIALALGACAVQTSDTAGADVSASSEVQALDTLKPYTGPSSTTADETCTETFGACKVVTMCEGIRNDTRQIITETCCTAPGQCTVEHYGLCGC